MNTEISKTSTSSTADDVLVVDEGVWAEAVQYALAEAHGVCPDRLGDALKAMAEKFEREQLTEGIDAAVAEAIEVARRSTNHVIDTEFEFARKYGEVPEDILTIARRRLASFQEITRATVREQIEAARISDREARNYYAVEST